MTKTALDIKLEGDDRTHLAAAAELYCKHLDKLAKAAKDMGRTQDEAGYSTEAEKWRKELVEPVGLGQEVVFFARHMPVLEKGCIFLAGNMKAAKGTLTPFRSFDVVIESLEIVANHILNDLSVKFTPVMAQQAADGESK